MQTDRASQYLEAALSRPDDDEPRLEWANEIGGERGEFVAVACAVARGKLPRAVAVNRRLREAELLRLHGEHWAGLAGLAAAYRFRRGFVESANVDSHVFTTRGEELFRAAPLLDRIELDDLCDAPAREIVGRLESVIASPRFARVRTLRLVEAGRWVETDSDTHPRDFESAGNAVLRTLIEKNAINGLRGLELPRCALSGSDVDLLASCPDASRLTSLNLRNQDVDRYTGLFSEDVAKIVESPHLANLEALDVAGALGQRPDVGRLPEEQRMRAVNHWAEHGAHLLHHPRILRLRDLGMARSGFMDVTMDALASAPFERLERLDLSSNILGGADFPRLGAAPGLAHLKKFVFDGPNKYVFDGKMARALGEAPGFNALRSLSLRGNHMSPATAEILLRSPLAQRLEVIDLRANRELTAREAEWKRIFDGILLVGEM